MTGERDRIVVADFGLGIVTTQALDRDHHRARDSEDCSSQGDPACPRAVARAPPHYLLEINSGRTALDVLA
ncbi:MAG: hypothetical protein DHS20C19_02060 [Acidimicrobiales bacterium]|nr:MAG: hypothetical protein DHS20C19_02060 [Acidimicrobiales bacterium]